MTAVSFVASLAGLESLKLNDSWANDCVVQNPTAKILVRIPRTIHVTEVCILAPLSVSIDLEATNVQGLRMEVNVDRGLLSLWC